MRMDFLQKEVAAGQKRMFEIKRQISAAYKARNQALFQQARAISVGRGFDFVTAGLFRALDTHSTPSEHHVPYALVSL